MPPLLIHIVLVAVGSALGGLARWGVGATAAQWLGTAWPWGTFLINVSGSLLLGWFLTAVTEWPGAAEATATRTAELRLLVAVGFCGAFTTFSTYEYESHKLLTGGDGLGGTLYLIGSVAAGLLALRLGVMLARWGG